MDQAKLAKMQQSVRIGEQQLQEAIPVTVWFNMTLNSRLVECLR